MWYDILCKEKGMIGENEALLAELAEKLAIKGF